MNIYKTRWGRIEEVGEGVFLGMGSRKLKDLVDMIEGDVKMNEIIERTENDNVFSIRTNLTNGESNYPEADKFEIIREVVAAINRDDILSIEITRMDITAT